MGGADSVFEVQVTSSDFSAELATGQWGLRINALELFHRRSSLGTLTAAPPRMSFVHVGDIDGDELPPSPSRRLRPAPTVSQRSESSSAQGDWFLSVGRFAVEEMPVNVVRTMLPRDRPTASLNASSYNSCVVDIFGEGPYVLSVRSVVRSTPTLLGCTVACADVRGVWLPALQIALWKVIRDVTLSVWDMLTAIRVAKAAIAGGGDPEGGGFNPRFMDVNPPFGDAVEALRLCRLLENCISAGGEKLHRLTIRRVSLDVHFPGAVNHSSADSGWPAGARGGRGSHSRVRPPAAAAASRSPALQLAVTVSEFSSADLPEMWHLEDVGLCLGSMELVRVRAPLLFAEVCCKVL
jgi:hypothetical protein